MVLIYVPDIRVHSWLLYILYWAQIALTIIVILAAMWKNKTATGD